MLYLVTGENIDNDTNNDPKNLALDLEMATLPSFETMAKLEKEGKILAGGNCAGSRKGVAIINAKSNSEVGQLLRSLPFWGMIKWTVTPLETFDEIIISNKELLGQIRYQKQ